MPGCKEQILDSNNKRTKLNSQDDASQINNKKSIL